MTQPEQTTPPLFTRPPKVVLITSVLLLAFAVLAPAAPGFRAVTAFAAIMLLLLVRDRPRPTTESEPAPPPARHFPAAPTGDHRVDVVAPGPKPDDVAWVWRQFRAVEPAEHRTPEEFAQALGEASTSGTTVMAAERLSERAAEEFATALRRAGAEVDVTAAAS